MSIIAETTSIAGFIGSCLVDTETGLMLASEGVRVSGPFACPAGMAPRSRPGQLMVSERAVDVDEVVCL